MQCLDNQIRNKIVRNATQRKAASSKTSVTTRNIRAYNLQMYNEAPSNEISITEFDDIALERLRTLKAIEDIKDRFHFGSDEYLKNMNRVLYQLMPIACHPCPLKKDDELERARQRDVIGHFILRLAFCRSPESQKWFIQQEIDLFKFRFEQESSVNIVQFLTDNKIKIAQVSDSERELLTDELAAGCEFRSSDTVFTKKFWKIDFVEAYDLVRRRRCLLKKGLAYLPEDDLQIIVSAQLRLCIASAMNRAFKYLGMMGEGSRLLPRLARLANNAYSGKQYAGQGNEEKITRQMLNELSVSSFPLCMRQIHNRLRSDHHMKHGARRQYGLFLKAIGLSLDEAMMFMREEFTKKIDSDKFEKEYAYNIRHMYGKEGRRVDYPALPCSAIILRAAPAAGDCHGCPYKHNEPQMLAQRLEKEGLNKEQINTILNLSKSSQFDKACTRQFEFAHKMTEGSLGHIITHPNQYFELSQEVLSGKRGESHVVVAKTQVKPVLQNEAMDDSFED